MAGLQARKAELGDRGRDRGRGISRTEKSWVMTTEMCRCRHLRGSCRSTRRERAGHGLSEQSSSRSPSALRAFGRPPPPASSLSIAGSRMAPMVTNAAPPYSCGFRYIGGRRNPRPSRISHWPMKRDRSTYFFDSFTRSQWARFGAGTLIVSPSTPCLR